MKKLLFYLLLLMISGSCTEKINLDLNESYTRFVIDGSISTDTGKFVVNLTHTADYFYNAPIPRVPNAGVTLTDGDTTVILSETKPGISGIYVTDSTFHGKVGKTYTINVELAQSIGGYANYSATCLLPGVTNLDSTTAILHEDWGPKGVWEVKVFAQEPANETNYYMFNLYRNGKLWSDTITKVVVSDDSFFNGSYINGLGTFYINNEHAWETLYPGDVITLNMSGITKEYYNYVNEVKSSGFNIPFFVGPPANVVGNINNGGVGYFVAYSNSYASTVVK
jgi:hypothetical protein